MRQDFPGKHDYKVVVMPSVSTTGTGSGTSGWIDLGALAEQVDVYLNVTAPATNVCTITVYQCSTSAGTGSSLLTLYDGDNSDANIPDINGTSSAKLVTGVYKSRLQYQYDSTTTSGYYPWLGCINGRYIQIIAAVTGTDTTDTSAILGSVLTIAAKEYPVEK
jgi:hypothetical protein